MKHNSQQSSPVSRTPKDATEAAENAGPPPVILRLLAEQGRRKGAAAKDYLDLFGTLASAVGATDIFDYLAVLDFTDATFDILELRKLKQKVIEAARERRRDILALEACKTASLQRAASEKYRAGYSKFIEGIDDPEELDAKHKAWVRVRGEPMPPENCPPYAYIYSEADIAKFARPLDGAADDGQAFLDTMDALERIDAMIEAAEKRRDKAFEDIARRRRDLAERLRQSSNRIIEGTVNK